MMYNPELVQAALDGELIIHPFSAGLARFVTETLSLDERMGSGEIGVFQLGPGEKDDEPLAGYQDIENRSPVPAYAAGHSFPGHHCLSQLMEHKYETYVVVSRTVSMGNMPPGTESSLAQARMPQAIETHVDLSAEGSSPYGNYYWRMIGRSLSVHLGQLYLDGLPMAMLGPVNFTGDEGALRLAQAMSRLGYFAEGSRIVRYLGRTGPGEVLKLLGGD